MLIQVISCRLVNKKSIELCIGFLFVLVFRGFSLLSGIVYQ